MFLFFLRAKRVFLAEMELNTLDERFIKLLAWQRIQQLLEPKAFPVQSDAKLPAVPAVSQRSRHTEGTVHDNNFNKARQLQIESGAPSQHIHSNYNKTNVLGYFEIRKKKKCRNLFMN